jgi:hypothetical protein
MSITTTSQQNTPSLKQSLKLITSLVDTSPPVYYESRRPALRSVFSSPGGLSASCSPASSPITTSTGTTTTTSTSVRSRPGHSRKPTSYESPLTIHAPLDFPNVSPNSRTRAVSLVLPQPQTIAEHEELMPIGKLDARDKADDGVKEKKKLLRPIPKRSSTISPEIGHHTWGSLPPPRAPAEILHPLSPPIECLAKFTLSPPTGTMPPHEYVCESPGSTTDSPCSSSRGGGGFRSALAEPRVSQIEVTSTWAMPSHNKHVNVPMTTVDRVGPRLSLAKWEDRLSLPREPSLRRSVSMRNGIRDPDGMGHKRNASDSLLQGLPAIQSGVAQEPGRMTYLAHRPAPPVPGHGQGNNRQELRPTTRRSRTPVQYHIGNNNINKSSDLDRLSTLSRQTSTDSLKTMGSLRRGRSGSVREIVPNATPSPVSEMESKPMGTWERVREGASAVRSRRGSFASMWSTSRLASEVETVKVDGAAATMTKMAGLDCEVEDGMVDDLQTHIAEEGDLEENEMFIGFDDL